MSIKVIITKAKKLKHLKFVYAMDLERTYFKETHILWAMRLFFYLISITEQHFFKMFVNVCERKELISIHTLSSFACFLLAIRFNFLKHWWRWNLRYQAFDSFLYDQTTFAFIKRCNSYAANGEKTTRIEAPSIYEFIQNYSSFSSMNRVQGMKTFGCHIRQCQCLFQSLARWIEFGKCNEMFRFH